LIFGHKSKNQIKLHVDLGDLQNEKEQLSHFLHSKLKITVVSTGNKLEVDSENVTAEELRRIVLKFVYHCNFNNTHWVSIKGSTLKINRFKERGKEKEKHDTDKTLHQNAAESWGL